MGTLARKEAVTQVEERILSRNIDAGKKNLQGLLAFVKRRPRGVLWKRLTDPAGPVIIPPRLHRRRGEFWRLLRVTNVLNRPGVPGAVERAGDPFDITRSGPR
jgi:hypothetical protein